MDRKEKVRFFFNIEALVDRMEGKQTALRDALSLNQRAFTANEKILNGYH